jgi:hypothetical protein
MSEKIKMTDNELAEVRMLQEKFQQKIFQLGRLYLQKMNTEATMKSINEQEIKMRDEWNNLQKMENELIDKLLQKYGEGSLNLQEGTFVSEKSSSSSSK